jgi:hypothetical protein
MVPFYLAQMHRLKENDSDVYREFMQGNFYANNNEIPFCAIGPDYAIEHANKIKVRGALKVSRSNRQQCHGGFLPPQN